MKRDIRNCVNVLTYCYFHLAPCTRCSLVYRGPLDSFPPSPLPPPAPLPSYFSIPTLPPLSLPSYLPTPLSPLLFHLMIFLHLRALSFFPTSSTSSFTSSNSFTVLFFHLIPFVHIFLLRFLLLN